METKTESKKVKKPLTKSLAKKIEKVTKEHEANKNVVAKKITKDAVTQRVVTHRKLKYSYPKGMTDAIKRKAFRQNVRNTVRSFERKIAAAEAKDKAKLQKEFEEYKAGVIL